MCIVIRFEDIKAQWRRLHDKRERRTAASHRAHPVVESLEHRLAPSVGGGWIASTQLGQSGEGLLGEYYSNSSMAGAPSFTRWDDRVDFLSLDGNANPAGSPEPAVGSVGPTNWSAQWSGTLTANFSETYTFQLSSAANGARLWVAPVGQQFGNPIVNDWSTHGQKTDTATVTLQAGQDYNVELQVSETTATIQQVQLQWSSPSTPLEDIEPATSAGLNVDGNDALFANMVNGGTRTTWWAPENTSVTVPTDSNLWPEADAEVLLGEGDRTTSAGGSYLVQFSGMATVTNPTQSVDWWVDGIDLHSNLLQAGQGFDPSTDTTTATMVVAPSLETGFYMNFTNTSRTPTAPMKITSISEAGRTVTVSVSSTTGIAAAQMTTIAGLAGSAADYNGTYVITSVNNQNNTFTYMDSQYDLPANPGGGTAVVNPQNGITNLYVMQPSTLGGNMPLPVGTLFTPAAVSMAAQFTVLRLMDLNDTNGNLTSNWSDRTLVSDNFWSAYAFNSGTGVNTGVSDASQLAGVPWEIQVALANETGKDVYINVPSNASVSYLTNLANLFAYGSDGVTPYTSVQSDPVWKPLNSNLKVYIEFSNETWNSSFTQSGNRSDGWANQLSQRALYDYLTGNQADPLYPGGGDNAYNDGAVLATYYNVNTSNDAAFLGTYNPNAAPSADGGSPAYFNNSASINGYQIGQGWVGLRDVQISQAFKTAFGELNINAVDTESRVRPVFEWQAGSSSAAAGLSLINSIYGAQEPVSYYLYGGGGAWYVDDPVGGFSDVSFADPAFAQGLAGWSSIGSAGVATNGSSIGNPNAPPLFSAIAISGGAVESGNTVTITTTEPHNFAVGQVVVVSGVVIGGYNGRFTVTSVTPSTFTYVDTSTGLASSGDGIVTGTSSSTQTAYLEPGASISQNVTFSDGYADITLYATQTVPAVYNRGLTITLTPTNGGPAINNGQPIPESEGPSGGYSENQDGFVWSRTEAFYTGASNYTYSVTFTNTLTSGTVFVDNVAIQTVNGMFSETTAAQQSSLLQTIGGRIQSDVALALQYGLHDIGYEGGFLFDQNQSGYLDPNGYAALGSRGWSSSVPNVGMYANLDPRTLQLAISAFNQFYDDGGTLAIVFESSANINSWAVAAPTYFNWNTPKLQAAEAVEEVSQHANYGLTPGQSTVSTSYWLRPGQNLDSTYLLPSGTYTVTIGLKADAANPAGQTDLVEILVDGAVVKSVNVSDVTAGTFMVPIGELSAGQHSVEVLNAAPSSNGSLSLGGPGAAIFAVNYTTLTKPTISWSPSNVFYGQALSSKELDASASFVFGGQVNTLAGTYQYSPAAGTLLAAGNQTLTVTFTPSDAVDFAITTATVVVNVVAPVANPPATFLGQDTGTVGNWIGAYGTQGYEVIGNGTSLPPYATVTPSGQTSYTWASSTAIPGALEDVGGTSRIAACWYSPNSFTVRVNLTDGQTHGLELYFLDLNSTGRSEQVQISSGATGAVLNTELVTSFANGVYLDWDVSGSVVISITKISGPNAVLSGLFLDPTVGSASCPTVAWASPPSFSYGTALSSSQLDATASVPGTFLYTPAAGAILAAGLDMLSVTFTPTDTSLKSTTWVTTIIVAKAIPGLSVADGGSYDGAPLPAHISFGSTATGLDDAAAASLEGLTPSLEGVTPTLAYFAGAAISDSSLAEPPASVGTYTVVASFPGSPDYTPATAQATFSITAATPLITWTAPGNIVYGTVLGATQLNATANTAGTFVYSPPAGTLLKPGDLQQLSVTFTPTDTSDFTSASVTVMINVTDPFPDRTTEGNWIRRYGSLGYDMAGDGSSIPGGVTVTPGGTNYAWRTSTTASQALQNPGGNGRIAACWYNSSSFSLDVDITNGQSYNIALYLLDYDARGRSEQIQISNAASGVVLSTQSVSNFSSGVYLNWTISGDVVIKVINTGPVNAVLSGLFFDPASTPSTTAAATFPQADTALLLAPVPPTTAAATFSQADMTTQGNWIGSYGSLGYDMAGDGSSIPSGISVTPGGTNYTWSMGTTATQALQNPGGNGRLAACWYNSSSFSLDVDITNGQSYNIALYLLDYDARGRSEQIQISNAASGVVLSTQSVSNFSSGVYLNWTISGDVVIKVINTGPVNAVLSGLFFDPAPTPATTS